MLEQPEGVLFISGRGHIPQIARHASEHTSTTLLVPDDDPSSKHIGSIDHLVELGGKKPPSSKSEELSDYLEHLDPSSFKGAYTGLESYVHEMHDFRRRIGISHCPSSSLDRCMNKQSMRETLRQAGLSRLRSVRVDPDDLEAAWVQINGPCYLKPIYGLASLWVQKVETLEDFKSAYQQAQLARDASDIPELYARYLRKSDEFMLEEACDGELVSYEGYMGESTYHGYGLLSRILFRENPVVEMGSYFPAQHRYADAVKEKVSLAHKALGIKHTPTHVECIVSEDGHVEIIDFNVRFVGAHVLHSMSHIFETDMSRVLYDYTLGQSFPALLVKAKGVCCLQYFFAPEGLGILHSVEFPGGFDFIYRDVFIELGSSVQSGQSMRQIDVLGCFIVHADCEVQADEHRRMILEKIRINEREMVRW